MGGTITGLTANGLRITLFNAATGSILEELPVASGSTSFTFATLFSVATPAVVRILDAHHPTGQTCIVGNPQGNAGTGNITNVRVACATRTTSTIQGTYRTNGYFYTFYANGIYVLAGHKNNQTDVEYGIYNWNIGSGGAFSIPVMMVDTNTMGFTDLRNGVVTVSLVSSGSNLVATQLETGLPAYNFTLTPVPNASGGLAGVWSGAYPRDITIFLSDGTFMSTVTNINIANTSTSANFNGVESACYTVGGGSLEFSLSGCTISDGTNIQSPVNANGGAGWINGNNTPASWTYSVSGNTLTLSNASGTMGTFTRLQ